MKVFHETVTNHEHFFVRSTLAVFFSLSTHEQWNRAYSWRAFIAHSWRLGECNADLISCSPRAFLERVSLEQVTWTYAHSLNKLPENYSLSIHCPLMNHFWATHEPLMIFGLWDSHPERFKNNWFWMNFWFIDFGGSGNRSRHPLMIYSCVAHEPLMKHSWTWIMWSEVVKKA